MSFSAVYNHNEHSHSLAAASDSEAGRRVALGFNPSGHVPTDRIKVSCAAAMQAIIQERDRTIVEHKERAESYGGDPLPTAELEAFNDAMRNFATAMTHLQTASMFAVGGLHTRANAGITD